MISEVCCDKGGTVMTKADWIKIIVPIILSSIISIIITCANNRIVKNKKAKKVVIQRRLNALVKHIAAIKTSIIEMQCQMIDFNDGLNKLFITSGDLQVYMEDNRKAMVEELKDQKDIYEMKRIDELSETIKQVGILMNTNDTQRFGEMFEKSKSICDRLIEDYNRQISQAEYI